MMDFITTSSPAYNDPHPVWEKTATSTNQADPFCCAPTWQLAFHDAFSPKRRLFIKESSGSVLAFAEKIFAPNKIFLTPIEPHWFFGCPLLGRHAAELLYEAVEHIKKFYSPYFPEIIVSGIRPNGETARRLLRFFSSSFDFYLHSTGVQCSASLKGGIDGFLSRRSGNHRHKLKKESLKAAEKGVCFERIVPSSPEESASTYARMLAVEYASWKGIGKCGITEPPSRQFYDIMLRRLSVTKTARVIFAKREDKDIGFIFGGMAGRIYRGQQFSYDNEWKSFSIGNLMQMEQLRWLCQEGARRYDMGPRMDYKSHWTERETHIQTWIIRKK